MDLNLIIQKGTVKSSKEMIEKLIKKCIKSK